MGECVAGRAEGGDKDLGGADNPGQGISAVRGRPGEVHEGLFAGLLLKTHDDTRAVCPGAIELAEPSGAIPVGVLLMIFEPKEPQLDALAGQFMSGAFLVRECFALLAFGGWQGSGEKANRRACPCSCLQGFIRS